jgi:5-formyltetrahydrofolate cyclo-ligase
MKKAEIRRLYKSRRRELTGRELDEKNQILVKAFFDFFSDVFTAGRVKYVHTFIGAEKLYEPDTGQLIKKIKQDFSEIKIAAPRINQDALDSVLLTGNTSLKENQYGILEPEKGEIVSEANLDLVIVPLLAFDKKGFRVGYGGGFYDRLLAKCRRDTIKCGLSFFPPLDEIEDIGGHDIPLDVVITPDKVYEFQN